MDTLALYIHWPFCVFKCPYCDFNSHVRLQVDHLYWGKSLQQALQQAALMLPDRRLTSIFFGGGTPSLMQPAIVEQLIKTAQSLWASASDLEITLEANPGSVDNDNLPAFAAAGVNRLSLGVQSLNPATLQFLGRKHSADQAYQALAIAHKIFPRLTFDLMYALPQQTIDQWQNELQQALKLTKGHLSLYQLTIEEGTQFYHAHKRGQFVMPCDEKAGEFYEYTQQILQNAGLPAYEISNHAQDATQQSRHNLSYWRYEDYLGIGPGAHSRLTIDGQRFAIRDWKAPETWLKMVESQGQGFQEKTLIIDKEAGIEALMMGLRLTEGVDLFLWDQKCLPPFTAVVNANAVEALVDEGYLWRTSRAFGATLQGRQRLNAVLQKILL